MESSTALKSITSGQQNCRVFARLIRLWDAKIINPRYGDGLLSIDGILLDEDGNMAQMSVPKKYEKQFRGLLSEGSVYIISDIVAIDNKSKSYVYHHQNYMLQFKHDTKVHALHSRGANIPTVSFNFCPFDQLPRKAIDSKPLLGTIQGSSSSATQVYLDLNIPEVQHYRSSYQWKFPTLQKNLPKVAHLSPLEAAGKLYTIEQISTLPTTSFQGGATFSTIAKVTSIIPSVKWYYKACKRCGKDYNNMSDTPTCACQFPVPCPMYKLPLTLTDSSTSLDAVAFNKVAEDLVERHVEQVSMNMKIDAVDQVLSLDKAIGKERLFYIGMNIDSTAKYPIKCPEKNFPRGQYQIGSSINCFKGKNFLILITFIYHPINLTCEAFSVSTR
ncbi:uncharacterized protein [Triticum aestivum]|uniref:uncharacterized protein isoform X4 n=1 Tax=Triticum aestivum TaxID=4565 RepID=UPI001D028DAD|nr:uncharacterized protein LOC123061434 isoform X4 [Triticum aestivum]